MLGTILLFAVLFPLLGEFLFLVLLFLADLTEDD